MAVVQFMRDPLTPIHLIVVSTKDRDAQIAKEHLEGTVTLVKDIVSLKKAIAQAPCDGVIVEEPFSPFDELAKLNGSIDLSRTFFLAGPLPSLAAASHILPMIGGKTIVTKKSEKPAPNLGEYVETKFKHFVHAMKQGSARDLYSTLMKAVERPLIELALLESNGNQLQAARLLGMNRNTLRKKITEFGIPVGRKRATRTRL